jgi:protein-S-isoprenylcysteine O-methyltransferase Ste14
MNTEYAVGNIRIRFESQARRRWLVALFYVAVAGLYCGGLFVHASAATVTWIEGVCAAFFLALFIIFTWIAGDTRRRDEREMQRINHAHTLAHRIFVGVFAAALWYGFGFHQHLPNPVIGAGYMVFITLPGTILLWTEPDMEATQ